MKLIRYVASFAIERAVRVLDTAQSVVRRYPASARIDLTFRGENGEVIQGHLDADRHTLKEMDAQMRHNKHSRKPGVVKVSPSMLELFETANDPHKLGISHSIVDEFVPVMIEVHCTGFRTATGTHEMLVNIEGRAGQYRASFNLNDFASVV